MKQIPSAHPDGAARVKVLHVITRLIVGGAQDNTLLTVEGHDRSRYEVHVASNASGEWGERARRVADAFVDMPDLVNPISPRHDLRALWQLVTLMRRERYAVVHTHSSKAGVLGRIAARIAGVPCVIHTVHGFSFHPFMPPWQRRLFETLERGLERVTDATITVSELNRREAVGMGILREKRSQTVYSGIAFAPLDVPLDRAALRAALDLPADAPTVVNVGRLDTLKDPHRMLDAFAQVRAEVPGAVLLMVGDGPLMPGLAARVATEGTAASVRLLGSRADVADLLRISDVFALSTKLEGLGRAMTEAMLVGVPPVVPAIYGIPEIVHDDETGVLYPVGDAAALARGITGLLGDPARRARLGENARALTRRLFDAATMIEKIEEIYEHALASAQPDSPAIDLAAAAPPVLASAASSSS